MQNQSLLFLPPSYFISARLMWLKHNSDATSPLFRKLPWLSITFPDLTLKASYFLTSLNSSGLTSHQPLHALNFLLSPSIRFACIFFYHLY